MIVTAVVTAAVLSLAQPNGSQIPGPIGCAVGQPTGVAVLLACHCTTAVCNIGVACTSEPCDLGQNGTCDTRLWHSLNDNTCIPSNVGGLNPWTDMVLSDQTWMPTGPVTFRLMSRGTGAFKDAFAWYNAGLSTPAPADLHVVLDAAAAVGASTTLNVLAEPAWLGGPIGFAILTPESRTTPGTCAAGDCSATVDRLASGVGYAYFTQPAFDPDAAGGASPIHVLPYPSSVFPDTWVLAWEDRYAALGTGFTSPVVAVDSIRPWGLECVTGPDCADADLCNGAETCTGGHCAGGSPLVCVSLDECRVPSCDPAAGCIETPIADGTACEGACGAGTCSAGTCRCEDSGGCGCATGGGPTAALLLLGLLAFGAPIRRRERRRSPPAA
jgi:MYXO-CTERM domain-containing protein